MLLWPHFRCDFTGLLWVTESWRWPKSLPVRFRLLLVRFCSKTAYWFGYHSNGWLRKKTIICRHTRQFFWCLNSWLSWCTEMEKCLEWHSFCLLFYPFFCKQEAGRNGGGVREGWGGWGKDHLRDWFRQFWFGLHLCCEAILQSCSSHMNFKILWTTQKLLLIRKFGLISNKFCLILIVRLCTVHYSWWIVWMSRLLFFARRWQNEPLNGRIHLLTHSLQTFAVCISLLKSRTAILFSFIDGEQGGTNPKIR